MKEMPAGSPEDIPMKRNRQENLPFRIFTKFRNSFINFFTPPAYCDIIKIFQRRMS